uniref:sprouty-related, EVH1 domain-containing protein 3-like isoform X1 n=1 Tax=Callithrix jacchus TaxID=9483 RepID=UPI0023DD131C|nr:sprouty-related, EVH1 domain-containing protein 3-like isoform X1 [Callithrix jacchus]
MRCSCLFIILGAGWGLRGHGGGRRPGQPPAQPASPAARLSPRMGGRRSRFLGRRADLAGGRLSPPPLTTPPPAPRSLLSPSWFPRSAPASGPPATPGRAPAAECPPAAGRPQVAPGSSSPPRPGGGKQMISVLWLLKTNINCCLSQTNRNGSVASRSGKSHCSWHGTGGGVTLQETTERAPQCTASQPETAECSGPDSVCGNTQGKHLPQNHTASQ